MAEITFKFMDLDSKKDMNLVVNDIKRTIFPETSESTIDVEGMFGEIYQGMRFGGRVFEVDVTLFCKSESDRVEKLHELSNMFTLGAMESEEFELIFSDEPEVYYYAHISGISQPERLHQTQHNVEFTIQFKCSDPLGRLASREIQFEDSTLSFTPEGNADTSPYLTCVLKKDVDKIGIVDDEGGYVFVSNGVDENTQNIPVDKEPVVLDDAMNNINVWTQLSEATKRWDLEGNAIVASGAKWRTTANSITNENDKDGRPSFGTGKDKTWYGACAQRYLPDTYENWKVRLRVQFNNGSYARAKSKMELYLLDNLDRNIGIIGIRDNDNARTAIMYVRIGKGTKKTLYSSTGKKVNRGKTSKTTFTLTVGKKKVTITNKKGKKSKKEVPVTKKVTLQSDPDTSTFTTFYGYIQLEKRGKKFVLEFMRLKDNGQSAWDKVRRITYTDTDNKQTKDMKLSGFGIYSAKYNITEESVKKYSNARMYFADLKVWNLIDGGNTSSKAKPVARKGDEIVFNFETSTVTKNGYPMNEVYINSTFFKLRGGEEKTIIASPYANVDADWFLFYTPKIY